MNGSYDIYYNEKPIGQGSIASQGLYYRIRCQCVLPKEDRYEVFVNSEDKEENLGLLIPYKGVYCLEKSIPMKRLGQGDITFFVREKDFKESGIFVPIEEGKPFSHMGKLRTARLQIREGKPGVLLDK